MNNYWLLIIQVLRRWLIDWIVETWLARGLIMAVEDWIPVYRFVLKVKDATVEEGGAAQLDGDVGVSGRIFEARMPVHQVAGRGGQRPGRVTCRARQTFGCFVVVQLIGLNSRIVPLRVIIFVGLCCVCNLMEFVFFLIEFLIGINSRLLNYRICQLFSIKW